MPKRQKKNDKTSQIDNAFCAFSQYLVNTIIFQLLIFLVLFFHLIFLSFAGPGSGAFSTSGGGARDRIFDESFAAIADDANTMRWNPAGITLLQQIEVTFSHASLFSLGNGSFDYSDISSSVNEDVVNVAIPNFIVPFGISYHNVGTHGLIFTDEKGAILDLNGQYTERVLTLSTGNTLAVSENKLAFGVNLNNYTVNSLHKRRGFGIDTGFLLSPKTRFIPQVGLTLNGLSSGFELSSDQNGEGSIPPRFTIGFAYHMLQEDQLTIASGLAKTSATENWKYSIASEYDIYRFYPIHLSLRLGYQFRGSRLENKLNVDVGGWNSGFSLYMNRFKLDYSYEPHISLGNTHRMTVSILQTAPTENHWQNGMQHYTMLEDDSALTSFKRLIGLNPGSAKGYHQIARIYERKGELENAIQSLEQVKQIDANYFEREKLQQLIKDLQDQRQ